MKDELKITVCRTIGVSLSVVISITVITIGLVYFFVSKGSMKLDQDRIEMERENNRLNVRLDKFTYCMQSMMIESSKTGKSISPEKAQEICKGI